MKDPTMMTYIEQFMAEMRARGITPPAEIIADGKVHRFAPNGRPNKKPAWYVFHPDGIPAGIFGDWRTQESHIWRAKLGRKLSEAEEDEHRRRVQDMQRKREAEERKRHHVAQKQAYRLWDSSAPASDDHPYLKRKCVKSHGLRVDEDGNLIVPITNNGETWSVQKIGKDGTKHFLTGSRKKGGYFLIGANKEDGSQDPIIIVEGYATGATVHDATGYTVCVAFDAGNLLPVTKRLRELYPKTQLVVCADDDVHTPGNPGITKATEAAQTVGALLAVPEFGSNRPPDVSDFNDLARIYGFDAVRNSLARARETGKKQRSNRNRDGHRDRHQDDHRNPHRDDVHRGDHWDNVHGDDRRNDQVSSNQDLNLINFELNDDGSALTTVIDGRTPAQRPSGSNDPESAAGYGEQKQAMDQPRDQKGLPVPPGVLVLPNDHVTFSQSANSIFPVLAKTRQYFVRGCTIVELQADSLTVLTDSAFRTRLDRTKYRVMAYRKLDSGNLALGPKRCSRDHAKALLDSLEARELLPPIRIVSQSPVIVPGADGPVVLGPGYNEAAGGVLVISKVVPETVDLSDAVKGLLELIVDFDFATPSDKSRAAAAIVTPALRMGQWFHGPNPVQGMEADHSQAGKTFFQKMIRTIYGEEAYLVTKKTGGVGGFDESLSAALLSGRPFVAVDNFRGKLDSPFLEAAITSPEAVAVRVPHQAETVIDCSGVTFQLSSNGVETTPDLANRTSIVRIRKRPVGYVFQMNREERLEHIEKHRAFYLGCVFAVVKYWVSAGQPKLSVVRHEFKEWAGILGWIVQKVFSLPDLMEGHEAAQSRVGNPALSWLRLVCIAVERENLLDTQLSASQIAELSENNDIDLPGVRNHLTDDQARKQVGKLLARCYRNSSDSQVIPLENFEVHRTETTEYDPDTRQDRSVKRYRFLHPVHPVHPDHIDSSKDRVFSESREISVHTVQEKPTDQAVGPQNWEARI
jgi:putative DNA primase/helicase